MKLIFDYIYYRVSRLFFKWDGVSGNRGLWAVAMIQAVLITDSLLLILSFFWSRAALFPYSKTIGFSAVGLAVVLVILNGRKYDGRYNEFDDRWKDEHIGMRILKGFLVIIAILLPWVGLFLVSQLK